MTALPVPFQSNSSKYKYQGDAKLINAYAEQQGSDAKGNIAILPDYGLSEFVEITDTPTRGFQYLEDLDCIYSVHSNSAYKITYDGSTATATRVGTIPGNDVVQISRNQADPAQISVLSASGTYYIEADSVRTVTDVDLPTPIAQVNAGGYTAYGIEDGRFFLSSLNDCSAVDGTDFATAEQASDKLVGLEYDRGTLYLFGTGTIEPWRLTGNSDFPFEPITTQAIQKGLLARDAKVKSDNTLIFVGSDGVVYRLNGGQVQRISNHGIERLIQNDANQSGIVAFAHNSEGHSFVTLSGTDWTRVYDAATNTWHNRQSYSMDKWRARFSTRAWGKHIFGDTLSGKLLYLDSDSFEEDGSHLIWGVDSPPLHAFPNGGIVDAVHFDLATGYGKVTSTEQGYEPVVMLSVSKDGGNTFSAARHLSIGMRGDRVRVTARRLGRFGPLGMVFRLRISDPVVRSLVGNDVEVRPLKR